MNLITLNIGGLQLNMDGASFIVVAAMLCCFITVVVILLPLIKRREHNEIVRQAIRDQRKKVFQQVMTEGMPQEKSRQDDLNKKQSSKESMAALFTLEKLGGAKIRRIMVQAGYRSPNAPIIYIVARMALPIVFTLIAGMFVSNTEKELAHNVKLIILFGVALAGFFLPKLMVQNNAQKRQEEIQLAFPDALDMMLICVQGGVGLEAAINRITDAVADHSTILAEELGILSAELSMLNDRRSVFQNFAMRCGVPSVRTFTNAMVQAEQYGTSVAQALRVMAEELRDMRLSEAERKAAALPPKLTVPMILFFLPTLFVVILAPAIIKATQTFG